MPTYEYACTSCGEHVEVVQSFTDEPLTTCPACGGPLRKVFAPVGIVLKGSGFYKTDSRAAAKGAKAGSGRGDGDGSSSGVDSTKGGAPPTGAETGGGNGKGATTSSGSPGTGSDNTGAGGSPAGSSAPAPATSS